MPLHLAPISRRRFLARTLAAGAGVCAASQLQAAGRRTDPHTWVLFSDTHIAANREQLGRGVNMTANFQQAAREVLAWPERPAGLLINGDCAYNSGEPGDYTTFASVLDPLRADKIPIHLVLGNHDERDHFWAAFAGERAAKRPVAGRQTALIAAPRANWYILDSLEKTLSTPGLLGAEQLAWLAKALDENPRKPAMVVLHHNPGLTGNMGLKDTVALFEVIRPRRQVKAYFFGHTHQWKVEQEASGMYLVNLPPVAYPFHEGDPSGWVLATLQPPGMRLELRSLDTRHPAHGQVATLEWRT